MENPFRINATDEAEVKCARIREVEETKRTKLREAEITKREKTQGREETKQKNLSRNLPTHHVAWPMMMLMVLTTTIGGYNAFERYCDAKKTPASSQCVDRLLFHDVPICREDQRIESLPDNRTIICRCPHFEAPVSSAPSHS